MLACLLAWTCVALVPAAPASAQQQTTAPSGLPLPRFVSLRAGEVNMRSGPGVQYPVDWLYKRRHLPIEVIAEFQTWRKVRDHQGTQGWVHQTMLDGERTAIVLGRTRTLRAEADSNSRALARLEPDVIVRIAVCPQGAGWCRVRAAGFEGWIRRVELWGIRKDEAIE
ncbi:MAG: SH3 domain-containing protein [Rhodospirillales bacterium]